VKIFFREISSFRLLARMLLVSRMSALQIALFFTKNAITVTTAVTLPVLRL
jgi:hypothetical protein